MKTLITTFAFALMVFAFNTAPAHANEDILCDFADCSDADNPRFPDIVHIQDVDRELKEKAVAYIGSNFCLKYTGSPICQGSWWRPEGGITGPAGLTDDELDQKLASIADYCKKHGDCGSLGENDGTDVALTMPLRNTKICKLYPDLYFCPGSSWFNEDADSQDGSGGRSVADSGQEGSTSAAGANEQ